MNMYYLNSNSLCIIEESSSENNKRDSIAKEDDKIWSIQKEKFEKNYSYKLMVRQTISSKATN